MIELKFNISNDRIHMLPVHNVKCTLEELNLASEFIAVIDKWMRKEKGFTGDSPIKITAVKR